MQKQMVPEAMAAFHQSVGIFPDYAMGHRAIGEILLYQGHIDEAVTELRNAAGLAQQDPQMHVALAKALEAKGLHEEAEAEISKARSLGSPQ